MHTVGPTMTRRQLLRSAGVGAAGLALTGSIGGVIAGAASRHGTSASHPPVPLPRWHSRPDLTIPTLTVTHSERGASSEPIFIAPYNAPNEAQAGAVIADASGRAIWENPIPHKVTTNFQVQQYRGSPVLTWWEGSIEYGHGVGEYVIADTSYRTVRRVQAARGLFGDLHEFVITPRDTALLTTYVITNADLSAVGGSRNGTIQDAIFQELDLATGRVLLEWHSLERIPLQESYSPVVTDWDFFHINSVALDNDGNVLVSGRSTHTVYKIDRAGRILWRLGGKSGDFELGAGAGFAWQHDARRQPDGSLTVFDNGSSPAVEKLSRGLILDIDEQAMSATLLHQYTHPGVLASSQGSVQLLANGNVFVGWGETPRISEFDHSGHMLFDAVLGSEYECYRAFRLPWSGQPAEAPAIAVLGDAGSRTVYASWNGATEVDRWQLLAGVPGEAPQPVSSTPAVGFESALRAPASAASFAVQALDSSGAPLGRSRTVTPS
jgi:hypothetical protein